MSPYSRFLNEFSIWLPLVFRNTKKTTASHHPQSLIVPHAQLISHFTRQVTLITHLLTCWVTIPHSVTTHSSNCRNWSWRFFSDVVQVLGPWLLYIRSLTVRSTRQNVEITVRSTRQNVEFDVLNVRSVCAKSVLFTSNSSCITVHDTYKLQLYVGRSRVPY